MTRKKAHFETKEPFFETLLRDLRVRRIIKYIPVQSKVLDLGCGFQGYFLQKISKSIASGVGIDLNVNHENRDKIQLLEHDLNTALPFKNNSFNAVISMANIEHLSNPRLNLKEIHRVLRTGGILIMTTPSSRAKPILEMMAKVGLVSHEEINDHKQYYSVKTIEKGLKVAGFSENKLNISTFQIGCNLFVRAVK